MPGSNTRQRTHVLTVRLTDEEQAALSARAAGAGLSLGAYARGAMLGTAGPRVRRQPTAPRDELRRLKGELGRVGNNVNQIAWTLNADQLPDEGEVAAAMDELREVGRAIRAALGHGDPEAGP
jgi:hypothetical protein